MFRKAGCYKNIRLFCACHVTSLTVCMSALQHGKNGRREPYCLKGGMVLSGVIGNTSVFGAGVIGSNPFLTTVIC
jgi:hypothetical protein